MKRLHVHLSVSDLEASIRFYNTLFNATPSVVKSDYAKWLLEDPRVNFAISTKRSDAGLDHFGIQVDEREELKEVAEHLRSAEIKIVDEGATTCCYAESEKAWVIDPQGIPWETFYTTGQATVYGEDSEKVGSARDQKSACCAPEDKPVFLEQVFLEQDPK